MKILAFTAIILGALLTVRPGIAAQFCPEALAQQLSRQAPQCQLLEEGVLASQQGNNDVVFRLYRWVSAQEDPPRSIYDAPPYNQVAVTLQLARSSEDPPFWVRHYWLGVAWFERPMLVVNQRYGEMLIVPGRYAGTGSFVEDRVFMPTHGRTWMNIGAAQWDQESGEGWVNQLVPYLPQGAYLAKGIRVDYATLSGTSNVWRKGDANCCPSGGEITFRLELAARLNGPELALRVAEAEYRP